MWRLLAQSTTALISSAGVVVRQSLTTASRMVVPPRSVDPTVAVVSAWLPGDFEHREELLNFIDFGFKQRDRLLEERDQRLEERDQRLRAELKVLEVQLQAQQKEKELQMEIRDQKLQAANSALLKAKGKFEVRG
jgi:hypothetical protein